MTRPKVVVSLRGGLGNQIFQVAAGLATSTGQISIEWNLGKPQLNKFGKPEITSLVLPKRISLEKTRVANWLSSRTDGYLLRSGIEPKFIEKNYISKRLILFAGSGVLSHYFKELRIPFSANDTGYVQIPSSKNKQLLIGYFQSYIWSDNPQIRQELFELRPIEKLRDYLDLVELSYRELPLVVHVRLGDYKGVAAYGIPSPKYYESAIRKLMYRFNNKYRIFYLAGSPQKRNFAK